MSMSLGSSYGALMWCNNIVGLYLAGVSVSRWRMCPSRARRLLLILMLKGISFVRLYNFSLLINLINFDF